jgi:hypothetical protein
VLKGEKSSQKGKDPKLKGYRPSRNGKIFRVHIQRSARSSSFADTAELYAYLSTLGCMSDHTKTTTTPSAPKELAKQTFTKTFTNPSNTTTRAV